MPPPHHLRSAQGLPLDLQEHRSLCYNICICKRTKFFPRSCACSFFALTMHYSTFGDPLSEALCIILEHSVHILRAHGNLFGLNEDKAFGGHLHLGGYRKKVCKKIKRFLEISLVISWWTGQDLCFVLRSIKI